MSLPPLVHIVADITAAVARQVLAQLRNPQKAQRAMSLNDLARRCLDDRAACLRHAFRQQFSTIASAIWTVALPPTFLHSTHGL